MICSLPTYLQTHLSEPDRRVILLNWGKGMHTMKFPVAQWAHFLGSYSLSSILLPAACRYQARRSSRSGQPSFRRMYMRVLPLPPPSPSPSPSPENTHNATNPGRRSGSWFVVFRQFYLSACPVRLYCLQRWSQPNRSSVIVCLCVCIFIGLTPRAVLLPTFYFYYYRFFFIHR